MNYKVLLPALMLLTLVGCVGQTPTTEQKNGTDTTPVVENQSGSANPLEARPQPTATFTTNLKLVASTTNVKVGDMFTVKLTLSGAQEGVTTAAARLVYDPAFVEATKIDASESAFPMEFQNEIDKKNGKVTISRSNTKGVTGDDKNIVSVEFKAKKANTSTVSFDPNATMILIANNANVTQAVETLPSVEITVETKTK